MKKIITIVTVVSLAVIASVGFTACGAEEVNALTKDQAIAIALEEVEGAGTSDVTQAEKDFSDGKEVYDITIVYDAQEYEFEINAENGNILDRSQEVAENVITNENVTGGEFSLEAAKAQALSEVKGATEADIVVAHEDYDDGIREYEIEIHFDGLEYEYTFNADTGDVVEKSIDKID